MTESPIFDILVADFESKLETHSKTCLAPVRERRALAFNRVGQQWVKSHKGHLSPSWKGGLSFEPYCPRFNNEFRDCVRAFFGFKCVLCGKTQKENGRRLCVHHVNYKNEACCDEDIPKYFLLLCNSDHNRTNHNREKWQKRFTRIIEKRFKGKCFLHKKEQLTAYGIS